MELQLRFGAIVVGEILDPFLSDGTGYGLFRPRATASADPHELRVRAFIDFCEGWHARLRAGAEPDALEFEAYRDIWSSDAWHTVDQGGRVCRVEEPVFLEGEVTWRPA